MADERAFEAKLSAALDKARETGKISYGDLIAAFGGTIAADGESDALFCRLADEKIIVTAAGLPTEADTNAAIEELTAGGSDVMTDTFLAVVEQSSALSLTDEIELAAKAYEGDAEAKIELMSSYTALVIAVASEFMDGSLAVTELMDAGGVGLLQAADRYNLWLGIRFSVVAAWYIRQAILRRLAGDLPVYNIDVFVKEDEYGYERFAGTEIKSDEIDDMAKAIGISTDFCRIIADYSSVDAISEYEAELTSDDDDPNTGFRYIENIADNASEPLTQDEKAVFILLNAADGRKLSYEEIGVMLGLSPDEVRACEAEALRKINQGGQN